MCVSIFIVVDPTVTANQSGPSSPTYKVTTASQTAKNKTLNMCH